MHWNVSRSSKWLLVQSNSDAEAKPQGCVVPFIFDNKTAWVGFFIMNEAYRGYGWGAALFKEMLDEFKRHGCEYIGLDAVTAQKATYERRGFRETGMVGNVIHDGAGKAPLPGDVELQGDGWKLQDIRTIDPMKLVDLEERNTGFRRSRLWTQEGMWHRAEDDAFGFAATSPTLELEGFILVRACEHGYRFGPLHASSGQIATALLRAAMQKCGELNKDAMLTAEVYKSNEDALKMYEAQGWKDVGVDYHRMWIDAKATPQQSPGGTAEKCYWSIFDAAEG